MCFQTRQGRGSALHRMKGKWTMELTFSNPKNLSLPSARRGPALTRSFSSGVESGALGSLLTGAVPAAGLVGACLGVSRWACRCHCQCQCQCHCHCHCNVARNVYSAWRTHSAGLEAAEEARHGGDGIGLRTCGADYDSASEGVDCDGGRETSEGRCGATSNRRHGQDGTLEGGWRIAERRAAGDDHGDGDGDAGRPLLLTVRGAFALEATSKPPAPTRCTAPTELERASEPWRRRLPGRLPQPPSIPAPTAALQRRDWIARLHRPVPPSQRARLQRRPAIAMTGLMQGALLAHGIYGRSTPSPLHASPPPVLAPSPPCLVATQTRPSAVAPVGRRWRHRYRADRLWLRQAHCCTRTLLHLQRLCAACRG